jgi:hypothetical protein
MWYDYDTSPVKRKLSPKLWGATPDTGRGPFFFALVMSGTLQVAAKSLSTALLIITNSKFFFAYLLGDHALFQLHLAIRGDHCAMTAGGGHGRAKILDSVLNRVLTKAVVDFTSCWIIRSPLWVNNAYFLFNQLTSHASVFVSVHVYVSAGGEDLKTGTLWALAGSLFAAWVLTYVARASERVTTCASDSVYRSLAGISTSRAWSSPSTVTCST